MSKTPKLSSPLITDYISPPLQFGYLIKETGLFSSETDRFQSGQENNRMNGALNAFFLPKKSHICVLTSFHGKLASTCLKSSTLIRETDRVLNLLETPYLAYKRCGLIVDPLVRFADFFDSRIGRGGEYDINEFILYDLEGSQWLGPRGIVPQNTLFLKIRSQIPLIGDADFLKRQRELSGSTELLRNFRELQDRELDILSSRLTSASIDRLRSLFRDDLQLMANHKTLNSSNGHGHVRVGYPTSSFIGVHSAWSGNVHLYSNGRMKRPAFGGGTYYFKRERELSLFWDHWPPEKLIWDNKRRYYTNYQQTFRLIPSKCQFTKPVKLEFGLGNRINTILNYVHELDKVQFYWCRGPACDVGPEEIFKNLPVRMVCKAKNGFEDLPTPFHFRNFGSAYHQLLARDFLDRIEPSDRVSLLLRDDLESTDGYHVRALHPKSQIPPNLKLPQGSYLATDSVLLRKNNPHTLQIQSVGRIGGTHDYDPCLRSKQGMIHGAADWFNLARCRRVFEIGVKFEGMFKIHSTFLDACRIRGKEIRHF